MLMLVNRWNPLPEGYTVQLVDVPGGVQVDERIYQPLMEMLDAATEAGVGPIVVSGYRTQEKQQSLYDEKINEFLGEGYPREEAIAQAQQWVSVPGTSEHQTGLAVDINGMIWDVYPWLAENSYKGISDTIQKLVVDSVNQELDQILSNLTLAQMSGYYSDHYDKQEMYYI